MVKYEGDPTPPPFDTGHLKALPLAQLSEALIGEAQFAATQLEGDDRRRLEDRLVGICWLPSEEEQEEIDEWSDGVNHALNNFSQAIVAATAGENLEPEEAAHHLAQRTAGRALAKVDRLKQEIDTGIEKGVSDDFVDWVEGDTKYSLIQICEAQAEAGINYASEYVRETALRAMTHPGMRGVVLLHNVAGGDQESYRPAVESMQEGLEAERMGFDDASEGLKVVVKLMEGADEVSFPELKNLAIDLLARLRGWSGITWGSYTDHYAEMTAEFAAFLRSTAN